GWQISTGAITRHGATAAAAPPPPCNVALAGSNTIGEKLAPAIVAAYFRSEGYSVSEPQTVAEDEIRLTASKGPQVCTIDIRAKGSSVAFRELTAGTALIGMASRPIKESEIQALRDANAGDFATEAGLAEHVVALDGIAIIIHPTNA